MKKREDMPKGQKKIPLDLQEHEELAADILKVTEILSPWVNRFYKAYSVNGKEARQLLQALQIISSQICCIQDSHWYKCCKDDTKKSPYYGNGICHY